MSPKNILLTAAQRAGENARRITAAGGVGSVVVRDRDRRSIEITDLKVQEQHRKQGFGGSLMASALREGVRMGKTEVVLAAQDNGRGTLTRWYSGMGFTRTGQTVRGYPMMSAPIGQVLSNLARQPAAAPAAPAPVQAKLAPAAAKLAAPPRYIPSPPVQPRQYAVVPAAPAPVQAKLAPAAVKPAAPPRYIPNPPVQPRMAPARFTPAPLAPRRISRPMVQRMEAWCEWCTIRGCHQGSICKGTGGHPGIYQGRVDDQKFLSSQYGQTVSGETHQMEHPFGYDVLAHPLGVKRGSTSLAQRIENEAPAYHEEKKPHRKHEGTGNIKKYPRESGLNAPEYRKWQRTALKDQNPDIAMAINQMTYGHQKLVHDSIAQAQSFDSFIRMVKNMGKIPWADDKGNFGYLDAPTDEMKYDMVVYRFMITHHRAPNEDEQMQIVSMLGIVPSWW